MIPKADRDSDAAILAAATQGTWITAALPTASPEIRLGSFGPCVDTPRNMPVMVCIQAPGATFGDVAMAEATTFMCPGGEADGDYVIMAVGPDGVIANWRVDLADFERKEDR